eukprot:CAMPEP_0173452612 /NCGR_PEP_ID=MMETSP1357-20121228/49045_1 /TAXON_ID=77926 /ORGANISM="Hemiselmis rufescens, Strain PCC563" /LENGTH=64 /DNA_ID=CAMNT_0014419501 /DNA_START=45 /DNA_END=235 /DNA_ORIENTATION=+
MTQHHMTSTHLFDMQQPDSGRSTTTTRLASACLPLRLSRPTQDPLPLCASPLTLESLEFQAVPP